jgi:hypothetical protein
MSGMIDPVPGFEQQAYDRNVGLEAVLAASRLTPNQAQPQPQQPPQPTLVVIVVKDAE